MNASKLWAAIFYLEYQPAFNRDDTSAPAILSMASHLDAIDKLLVEYRMVVLDLKQDGRPRPELMTTFEKASFIPPAPVPPFVPAPPSTHPRYIQLKELLTSLEEDRVKIQMGATQAKVSFRSTYKSMKECIVAIRLVFGITIPRNQSGNQGGSADH